MKSHGESRHAALAILHANIDQGAVTQADALMTAGFRVMDASDLSQASDLKEMHDSLDRVGIEAGSLPCRVRDLVNEVRRLREYKEQRGNFIREVKTALQDVPPVNDPVPVGWQQRIAELEARLKQQDEHIREARACLPVRLSSKTLPEAVRSLVRFSDDIFAVCHGDG